MIFFCFIVLVLVSLTLCILLLFKDLEWQTNRTEFWYNEYSETFETATAWREFGLELMLEMYTKKSIYNWEDEDEDEAGFAGPTAGDSYGKPEFETSEEQDQGTRVGI